MMGAEVSLLVLLGVAIGWALCWLCWAELERTAAAQPPVQRDLPEARLVLADLLEAAEYYPHAEQVRASPDLSNPVIVALADALAKARGAV